MKINKTVTEVKTKRVIEDITKVPTITVELSEREAALIAGALALLSYPNAMENFNTSSFRAVAHMHLTDLREIEDVMYPFVVTIREKLHK